MVGATKAQLEEKRKETAKKQNMQITQVAKNIFRVLRQGQAYKVNLLDQSCTCPDYKEREVRCKHYWKVRQAGFKAVKIQRDHRPSPDFIFF